MRILSSSCHLILDLAFLWEAIVKSKKDNCIHCFNIVDTVDNDPKLSDLLYRYPGDVHLCGPATLFIKAGKQ